MNKFFRALIAGWGAKKLGGGCFSTIIIFIIIYTLLGKCNEPARAAVKPVGVKTMQFKQIHQNTAQDLAVPLASDK